MSSITRVIHPGTCQWFHFTSNLSDHFNHSPKVVKEAIMTYTDGLVQEFWRTSSDRDVGASFFEMRRLFEVFQSCFDNSKVCFGIISMLLLSTSSLLIKSKDIGKP